MLPKNMIFGHDMISHFFMSPKNITFRHVPKSSLLDITKSDTIIFGGDDFGRARAT
jgi:hypothetical protein